MEEKEIIDGYIKIVTSPEGRAKQWESSPKLIQKIIELASPKVDDVVLDLGAGWGALTLVIAEKAKKVIAVDPSKKNFEPTKEKAKEKGIENIDFVIGSFLGPNISEKVTLIVSGSAFCFLKEEDRKRAIELMHDLLKEDRKVVLSDQVLFFDPEKEPEKFDQTVRYFLPNIMEESEYATFKPYMEHKFTWDGFKKYYPQYLHWYIKANDLIKIFEESGFKIEKINKITPFFGIICAKKIEYATNR
jgi:cyclopropane fatty-acyl-phospholipid synthase-like methyltransferase